MFKRGKREVTKEELEEFVQNYSGKLREGVFKAATPPVKYYNDVESDKTVATIVLHERLKGTDLDCGYSDEYFIHGE